MSRYQVDKVMREVIIDPIALKRFKKSPSTYLAGRDLTSIESEALAGIDYATLYSLGAHPFLLYGFTVRVWPGDRAKLRSQYRQNIAPFGYPDFST